MMTHKFPLILLLMIIVVSTVSFLPVQEAKAVPVELAYDDGTAWTGLSSMPPIQSAVRFSLQPGWSSAKILKARYFIWSQPDTFKLHIYGSDGSTELLTPPLTVAPAVTGWFDVDLSSYNIVVSGDFYISIEWTSSKPAIGMDDTTPIDLRSYSKEPPGFLWVLGFSSDLMIRALVDPATPVGGVVLPTNKLEIVAPYLALAGLILAVSTVVLAKRKRD